MKGLILNSGLGKRMGTLTNNIPKCLVPLHGNETVLSRQIRQLVNCGITDIIMTTGPFKGMIEGYLSENFPKLNVTYVQNDDFASTNYIYSMYLADSSIREDLVLMHGDIVTEENVLSELLNSSKPNLVIVDKNAALPDKDFKGRIQNGIVTEIGLDVFGDDCKFLLPVYKFSREKMQLWMDEIKKFVDEDNLQVYAENAFNLISTNMELDTLELDGRICMEIDNPEDHKRALELLKR